MLRFPVKNHKTFSEKDASCLHFSSRVVYCCHDRVRARGDGGPPSGSPIPAEKPRRGSGRPIEGESRIAGALDPGKYAQEVFHAG